MTIYVGNIPYSMTEEDIEQLFKPFGKVDKISLQYDLSSGRFKGFGYVEMNNQDSGKIAIEKLNGTMVEFRELVINEIKPKPEENKNFGFSGGRRKIK